jgi:peroxiredoxin
MRSLVPRRVLRPWAARVGCLVLLASAAFAGSGPRADAAGWDLTGRPAPEIHAPVGLNGLPSGATLASFRGKVVVVKFFFIGCPTCRASMPGFQDLYARYAPHGVQFVGLAYDERGTVERYLHGQGLTFPVAIDATGVTPGRYGVQTYPTDYVIGADGVVLSYDRLTTSVLDRALAEARARANVEELGSVPAALAGVTAAARANDYGLVLRLVEGHLDAAKDGPEVVSAATRIRAVARTRFDRRVARVRGRWSGGDRAGALREARAVETDFAGTSAASAAHALVEEFERGAAAARLPAR